MIGEAQSVVADFKALTSQAWHLFPQKRTKLDATTKRGVYIIASPAGKIVHVGSTPRAKLGIEQRLKNHLAGQSSFAKKSLNGKGSKLRGGYRYCFLKIGKKRQRALVEAYAIGRLCPKHLGA